MASEVPLKDTTKTRDLYVAVKQHAKAIFYVHCHMTGAVTSDAQAMAAKREGLVKSLDDSAVPTKCSIIARHIKNTLAWR